jgi:O-antigen ligase
LSPVIVGVYLAAVILLALALATRADHRPLVAVLLIWLMGYPVLVQEAVMPRIAAAGFDLQPTRMLLLILLPALVIHRLDPKTSRKRSSAPLASFEKLLIAFVVIAIASLVVNYGSLGLKPVVSGAEKLLAFGVLYFVARDYLTRGDYRVLARGLVWLAVFSAVAAIVQYVVDPGFFRVGGDFRGAFGDVGRSTGAFGQEYEHAIYMTFVVIAVGLWGRGLPMWQWISLMVLFGISVAFTFQRMPWAVFLFAVLGVLAVRWWNNPRWRGLVVVAGGLALVFVLWVPWSDLAYRYLPHELVKGRLFEDTLTGRVAFNEFALSLIPRHPLGLGETIGSPVYTQEYFKYGFPPEPDGVAYTVHNGFLSATVRYGIAGGLAFGCMLLGFLLVPARRATAANAETFILPLIAAVLILYNVTEDFSSPGGQTMLIAGLLMGYFVGQNLDRSKTSNRKSTLAGHWTARKAGDRAFSDGWRHPVGE